MTPRSLLPAALAAFALATTAVTVRADDGATLYQDHCRKCHGRDGQAHNFRGYLYFARDFTDAAWQARHSDDDIYRAISDSPGWYSVMPAFRKRLSEDERRALVQVVRRFGQPTP